MLGPEESCGRPAAGNPVRTSSRNALPSPGMKRSRSTQPEEPPFPPGRHPPSADPSAPRWRTPPASGSRSLAALGGGSRSPATWRTRGRSSPPAFQWCRCNSSQACARAGSVRPFATCSPRTASRPPCAPAASPVPTAPSTPGTTRSPGCIRNPPAVPPDNLATPVATSDACVGSTTGALPRSPAPPVTHPTALPPGYERPALPLGELQWEDRRGMPFASPVAASFPKSGRAMGR